MSTQAEIVASPGDKKITVTIKKVYRESSANTVEADFENPILLVSWDEGEREIDLKPYLITDTTQGGVVGTIKDATSIGIDNLENGKAYSVSYYQKGIYNDELPAAIHAYKAVYPHSAPPQAEVYAGTTGEPSNNYYNGYTLKIKLNDYDHRLPDSGSTSIDKVEYVVIKYTRLTGTDEQKKTKVISLSSDNVTDLSAITFIRTQGYYTFPNNTLAADAEYRFIVTTISDGAASPPSTPVRSLMKKVAQKINTFSLTLDANKRNVGSYTFNVDAAAKTNQDYYKLYKLELSGDSVTESLINDISYGQIILSSSDTSGNVSGTVPGILGQIIRLKVVPYSKDGIMGIEKFSNSLMMEGLKNHMVEINLRDIKVKDGEGNATLVFKTSHRKEELPYESRNIDLASLTNDRFDLYLPDKTKRLTEKLTLADDGTASIAIFMKGKTSTDLDNTNLFTLTASGYNAVYSQAAVKMLELNSNSIKLLTASTVSKTFNFDVTTVPPPPPTIIRNQTKFLENYISVRWSSANITKANAPTEYIVKLTSSNDKTFKTRTDTIINGDEYYNFSNLQKVYLAAVNNMYTNNLFGIPTPSLGLTALPVEYTVSVTSRNSAGDSAPAMLTHILEDPYFPPTYLQNLRIEEPLPRSITATRTYEGKIKINKHLWGGQFNKLTITRNDEYGVPMSAFTTLDILSNTLTPTGVAGEYKFNFDLSGIDIFNLQINAETLAVEASGSIVALPIRTSLPLFNTVVLIDTPVIKKVKFTINNKRTYYEVRVDPRGATLPGVTIHPVPADGVKLPDNLITTASYVQTYPNGEHLYKIEFPFAIRTEVIGGVTYGSETTTASNERGNDDFGKMYSSNVARHSSEGAMDLV